MADNKGQIVKRGVIAQKYQYTISDDDVVTIKGTGELETYATACEAASQIYEIIQLMTGDED